MEIDLKPFCSTDPVRPYLHAPFSLGGHTYATNGHILVRVPQRKDAPAPVDNKPRADTLFGKEWHEPTMPLPAFQLPPEEMEDCTNCDGEKHSWHSCPSCSCTCEACDDDGRQSSYREVSVGFCGAIFDARYAKMLQGLPFIRIAVPKTPQHPLPFSFDGGDGLLMPMRSSLKVHVEAAPAEAAT